MSTVKLDIVTAGWDLPGWGQDFYPEDLPVDWRLTYFANEFPSVMIPRERWAQADESLLHTWYEDVHEDFRFYLADPGPGPQVPRGDMDRARRILGARLEGLVLEERNTGVADWQLTRFQLLDNTAATAAADCLPAWRIPPGLIDAPRAARAWLESLDLQESGGRGLLVLGGTAIEVDDLRRWWDLAWLMGVAA